MGTAVFEDLCVYGVMRIMKPHDFVEKAYKYFSESYYECVVCSASKATSFSSRVVLKNCDILATGDCDYDLARTEVYHKFVETMKYGVIDNLEFVVLLKKMNEYGLPITDMEIHKINESVFFVLNE